MVPIKLKLANSVLTSLRAWGVELATNIEKCHWSYVNLSMGHVIICCSPYCGITDKVVIYTFYYIIMLVFQMLPVEMHKVRCTVRMNTGTVHLLLGVMRGLDCCSLIAMRFQVMALCADRSAVKMMHRPETLFWTRPSRISRKARRKNLYRSASNIVPFPRHYLSFVASLTLYIHWIVI